jgi:hypothetical protein
LEHTPEPPEFRHRYAIREAQLKGHEDGVHVRKTSAHRAKYERMYFFGIVESFAVPMVRFEQPVERMIGAKFRPFPTSQHEVDIDRIEGIEEREGFVRGRFAGLQKIDGRHLRLPRGASSTPRQPSLPTNGRDIQVFSERLERWIEWRYGCRCAVALDVAGAIVHQQTSWVRVPMAASPSMVSLMFRFSHWLSPEKQYEELLVNSMEQPSAERVAFVEYTPGSGFAPHMLMGIVSSPANTTFVDPSAFCVIVTVSDVSAHGVPSLAYVRFHVPQGVQGPTGPPLELLPLLLEVPAV